MAQLKLQRPDSAALTSIQTTPGARSAGYSSPMTRREVLLKLPAISLAWADPIVADGAVAT